MAQPGLKSRCYRSIARLAAAIWLLLSALLLIVADRQTTATFDQSLREIAGTLLAFSGHELAEIHAEGRPPIAEQLQADGDHLIYQVWGSDGTLAYRNAFAPATPLASAPGFGTTSFGGSDLRTFTAWNDAHTFQIQIASSLAERTVYFMALSVGLSLALLLSFVIFMSLVRLQLDRSFRPLEATARLLADKSTDDLSAIGTPEELPEIAPVIDAFNKLMTRVDRSMRQERRFADDAAHALRTPLTSLKILVGNLQRAPDDAARGEALGMINGVIERSSAHVNQLLRLARIDREPNAIDLHERIDLVALAQAVIDEFAALAAERSLYIRRSGSAKSIWIRGNEGTLSLALRSMVENAVSFVQRYGTVLVEVVLDPASDSALLRVHDDGPGVENDLQDRVFSLFFKADRSDTAHAGLGLPLVARIAQIHKGLAYVGVSTLLGGAMAVIRLPWPREDPASDPHRSLASVASSELPGLEH